MVCLICLGFALLWVKNNVVSLFFFSTSRSECLTLNEVTRIAYYLVLTLLVSESILCAELGDVAKREGKVWSLNPEAFLTSCMPLSQVIRLPSGCLGTENNIYFPIFLYDSHVI